jgi:predicted unusual protein kinase regulating ubiquinone biosynthesis (AarF/ABC1/UbiB family)
MATSNGSLPDRMKASPWVAESPGLADEAITFLDLLGSERAQLAATAADLVRPGAVSAARIVRHVAAFQTAQLRWLVRDAAVDFADELSPLRDPARWAQRAAARVLRDQLALLGPSGAEIARQLEATEGIVPGVVVEELRSRPLRAVPMPADEVEGVVARALGSRVHAVDPQPIAQLPLTQLHAATTADGADAMVRVRRPGAWRDLGGDIRFAAGIISPLEQFVPAVQAVRPGAFVELIARALAESTDLRHEALNAVEMGVVAEELGVTGIEIARPIPGAVTAGAAAFERLTGATFTKGAAQLDSATVLTALTELTVTAALSHGVFLAELSADHLLVRDDGAIAVVGLGTVGHFDIQQRRGLLQLLTSLLSGDFAGQIEALRVLRAVSPRADVAGLQRDMEASPKLQPVTLMMGGEESLLAGLKEAVDLALRHRVYPPVEVALFVRNLYALRNLSRLLPPGPGLMNALMPLVQRLPLIAAELDRA